MTVITPIASRVSLREKALANLRQAIVPGKLPSGSLISEQGLADQLHISRTPAREALLQLRAEELAAYRTCFVTHCFYAFIIWRNKTYYA